MAERPTDVKPDQHDTTVRGEVNPSQTLPNLYVPQSPAGMGLRAPLAEPEDYDYYLRDGATPYRTPKGKLHSYEVFSKPNDGWMRQNSIDPSKDLWDTTPNEVAGMIGGKQRLAEPAKGGMPYGGQTPLDKLGGE